MLETLSAVLALAGADKKQSHNMHADCRWENASKFLEHLFQRKARQDLNLSQQPQNSKQNHFRFWRDAPAAATVA